jgi:hypothetical protein
MAHGWITRPSSGLFTQALGLFGKDSVSLSGRLSGSPIGAIYLLPSGRVILKHGAGRLTPCEKTEYPIQREPGDDAVLCSRYTKNVYVADIR